MRRRRWTRRDNHTPRHYMAASYDRVYMSNSIQTYSPSGFPIQVPESTLLEGGGQNDPPQ
jgi:hypothetical protein